MRMASTNSKPISAVCHALPENEEEGHLLFVQWGGNCYEWGLGKCAFTTVPEDVKRPEEGVVYR